MRVLLAGATGAVGAEVLHLLVVAGHYVRTLSRDAVRVKRLEGRAHEVRLADATRAESLLGVGEGIDVVVSCLGANVSLSLRERRGFDAIDAAANLNLLGEANRAGVQRFVYLAALTDSATLKTRYIAAHERVVAALAQSGIGYSVVRPTGIFSAFADLIPMARRGPVPRIASGQARTNPIHHADVAHAIVAVLERGATDVPIGGPDVLSRKQIAELAFAVQGKRPLLVPVPAFVFRFAAFVLTFIHPRLSQMLAFVLSVSTHDCIAPVAGDRHLADYFKEKSSANR